MIAPGIKSVLAHGRKQMGFVIFRNTGAFSVKHRCRVENLSAAQIGDGARYDTEEILSAECDMNLAEEVRGSMPVFRDRHPGL